jgi:hypothetical protein
MLNTFREAVIDDQAALRRLAPSLEPQLLRQLAAHTPSQRGGFTGCEYRIFASIATAYCGDQSSVQDAPLDSGSVPVKWKFSLRRIGGAWQIEYVSVEHHPRL